MNLLNITKNLFRILLVIILVPLAYIVGWLVMVLITWMLLAILGKIGFNLDISIWWTGLFLYIIWLLFGKK